MSAISDRRFRPFDEGELKIPCRLCYRPIQLLAEHVEESFGRFYYRCQECHASFPIRDEDANALLEGRPLSG